MSIKEFDCDAAASWACRRALCDFLFLRWCFRLSSLLLVSFSVIVIYLDKYATLLVDIL